MPAPVGRDLELTRKQLTAYLAEQLPEARDLSLGELTGPGGTGFSSDTLLVDAHYSADGRAVERGFVVRIQPSGFQLFPDYDLPAQFAIMRALAGSDVAVPEMLWEERTGDVIGDAFYVMAKVEGRAPADNPPYTAEGWLHDMPPADQTRLWDGYLETLAAVHRKDPEMLGLGFLARPDLGETPIAQELAYYEGFLRWAWSEDEPHPVIDPGLEWLRANQPPPPEALGLSWGDARIGNMLFQGPRCVAVLDWEMARLTDPTVDLAWGLFLDRYHSEGNGLPRLPGFPEREETIRLYEEKSGRKAEHLEYYEILAGMRFSVILARLARQLKHYEVMPPDVPFEIDNPVCNLHRKQLEAIGVL